MKYLNAVMLFFFVIISSNSIGQQINPTWEKDLTTAVEAFKVCKGTIENNVNPCSKFTGESVNKIYKVNDFYSDELKRYLTNTEITKSLEENSHWKKLGFGLSQESLTEAQNSANSKKAVVAVFSDDNGIGHVAIILPGSLTPSGSWGLNVPNSASFFMNSPSRSYTGKSISYAFTKSMINKVIIYERIY